MRKPARPVLTEDDLALAWFACGLASAFWRDRGAGRYGKKERAKFDALSDKLGALLDIPPPKRKGGR